MPDKGRKAPDTTLLSDVLFLLLKLILICTIFVMLFLFVFGALPYRDNSMAPAIKDGDLVIYYRLQKDYQAGDAIVVETEDGLQVRRVVAVAGDTVDITEEGLAVNGYLQQESGIYTETLPYTEGIRFPVTVGEGQVFVLADNRENAEDSRIYGPVDISSTRGTVITLLRRRKI